MPHRGNVGGLAGKEQFRKPEQGAQNEVAMKNPIKLAAWTLIIAVAAWISIVTVKNIGQPRHWGANPEIGHRAAHQSGNPPP